MCFFVLYLAQDCAILQTEWVARKNIKHPNSLSRHVAGDLHDFRKEFLFVLALLLWQRALHVLFGFEVEGLFGLFLRKGRKLFLALLAVKTLFWQGDRPHNFRALYFGL